MTAQPFHVVGGSFPTQPQPVEIFAGNPRHHAAEPPTVVKGSRRRKLWEISHKFHCPIIGVCFDVDELRALMGKVMHFPRDTSDFVLHTTAVGACEERSQLANILHKHLERRFQLSIRRFATARDSTTLADLWREEALLGVEISAALWVCWTHPACDARLEQQIYGDIHMIQHQVGSGSRADLATLKNLHADNEQLRRQLDAARRDNESLRAEKSCETRALGQRIVDLRADLAGKEVRCASLSAQLDLLRDTLPDLKDRQALARRANDAEAWASALTAHAATLEEEISRIKRALDQTSPPAAPADDENGHFLDVDRNRPVNVAGKCVLCVGGRSGAVDAFRAAIEQRGGRFLHHDGGLEESLHRIDVALAAADLVICQSGCISHNAYWRVKEQCKRTGKPCIFMKRGGVSGLSRLIEAGTAGGPLPVVQSRLQESACSSQS